MLHNSWSFYSTHYTCPNSCNKLRNSTTRYISTITPPICLLIIITKRCEKFPLSSRLGYSTIYSLILSQSFIVSTFVQPLFYHIIWISLFLSILNIAQNVVYLVAVVNIANPGCVWKHSYLNFSINVNSHPICWITNKTYQSLHCITFWPIFFGVWRKNWFSCSNDNLFFISQ